ncbi:VOC family protein [Streptomyces sp. PU-14G]|uniref:VOC family protein n=1 Tax=Streptomyces sp. PU-14G TaxID=2800808 RepID=UPI0034DE182B
MHVVRGIDHIGVTVPDIEAATEFFVRALGAEKLYDTLPREEGPKGGEETVRRLGVPTGTEQVAMRMLRLPRGPGLELFEFSGPCRREAAVPSDLGWQHLACYVEDLSAACAAVREAGGTVLGEPRPLPGPEAGPRNRFLYCRTPWGSTLELLTYPDPMPYEDTTELRRWRP